MAENTEQNRKYAKLLEDDLRSSLEELTQSRSDIKDITSDEGSLAGGGVPTNHMADYGDQDYERERLATVEIELEDRIQMIRDAQQRLADGTYGICQRCGRPIPQERLEALPFAAYDIECQEIIDNEVDVEGLKPYPQMEPFNNPQITKQ
jgi:RNA polymerase-binding transcription factor DksA